MAQYIKQGDIFGRIGTGFGKGLAEQVPKEIERNRLQKALSSIGDEEDLTPFQKFTRVVGAAHEYPQIAQSAGELLRQEGIARGFRNVKPGEEAIPQQTSPVGQRQPDPFEQQRPAPAQNISPTESKTKGLVSPESTQAALNIYIPKTRDEILQRASQLYDNNRQLYPNPEMAIKGAMEEDQQNQAISAAKQSQRSSSIGVEDRVRSQLSDLRKSANAQIPDNVYQAVENDVIDKINEGRSELEATKEGQKKLDQISREYNSLDKLGNWLMPFGRPSEKNRSMNSLREDFKKRDDLENFADSLVGRNGISYPKAYYKAYKLSESKEVNDIVKGLPELKQLSYSKGFPEIVDNKKHTIDASKKLAPLLKSTGASPLAVSEALRMKNYDPVVWMEYVTRNKDKLDLSARQNRELDKDRNWLPSLNDLFLFLGTGDDELVE